MELPGAVGAPGGVLSDAPAERPWLLSAGAFVEE